MDCTAAVARSQCGSALASNLWILTPAFATCSANAKGCKPEMKYCHQEWFTGGGTYNEILCLYDKIGITIVQSLPQ